MSRLRSGLFFFFLSLFVIWESLRLGLGTLREPGSGFISFCTAVIMAFLSLSLTLRGWKMSDSRLPPLARQTAPAVAALIVYSFLLNTLGFALSTFLLVGTFFRLGGEERPWWFLAMMSTLVTFLAYLIFGVLFRVYLPKGFVGI